MGTAPHTPPLGWGPRRVPELGGCSWARLGAPRHMEVTQPVTDLAQQPLAATHWRTTLQRAVAMMVGQFGPKRTRDMLITYLEQLEIEYGIAGYQDTTE